MDGTSVFSMKNYIRSAYLIVRKLAVTKCQKIPQVFFSIFTDGKLLHNPIHTSDVVFHAEHARTIYFSRKLIV